MEKDAPLITGMAVGIVVGSVLTGLYMLDSYFGYSSDRIVWHLIAVPLIVLFVALLGAVILDALWQIANGWVKKIRG